MGRVSFACGELSLEVRVFVSRQQRRSDRGVGSQCVARQGLVPDHRSESRLRTSISTGQQHSPGVLPSTAIEVLVQAGTACSPASFPSTAAVLAVCIAAAAANGSPAQRSPARIIRIVAMAGSPPRP